jgi:hypothetical protein
VVITQRTNDFHAAIAGEAGVWGSGGSAAEALGQLVFAHPGRFGVTIDSDIMPRGIRYEHEARA